MKKEKTTMTEQVESQDPYEQVLVSIASLPEPEKSLETVAENYKAILYGGLVKGDSRD